MKGVSNHVARETLCGRKPRAVPPDKPGRGPGSKLAGRRNPWIAALGFAILLVTPFATYAIFRYLQHGDLGITPQR